MDASNTRKRGSVSQDRLRSCGRNTNRQADRRVCTAGEVWDRATGGCVSQDQSQETKTNKPIKTSIAIIGVALAFIFWGIWVSTTTFKGELPDGRWEWSHGTHERISEVIKLEDQHGDE